MEIVVHPSTPTPKGSYPNAAPVAGQIVIWDGDKFRQSSGKDVRLTDLPTSDPHVLGALFLSGALAVNTPRTLSVSGG